MFKEEKGFSLVELAIAAGLAVALAATAVTVLSGTTASLSNNAAGAAADSDQYNIAVLSNSGVAEKFGSNVVSAAASDADAPQNVSAVAGGNKIKVNWTAPVSGVVVLSYIVEYSSNSDFSGSKLLTANATASTLTINSLNGGTQYYVRVLSNAGNGSYASPVINVSTPAVASEVVNVAASAGVTDTNLNSIVLTWEAPATNGGASITGYAIKYSTDSSFASGVTKTVTPSAGTSSVLIGVDSSTTYYVSVAAITSAGEGQYSSPASVDVP